MSLRGIGRLVAESYRGPYRRTLARAARDADDALMLFVVAEELGVPNPMNYYALELLLVVYHRVHEWHRRMGMPRSPFDHVTCC
jgi:hypothetical protein